MTDPFTKRFHRHLRGQASIQPDDVDPAEGASVGSDIDSSRSCGADDRVHEHSCRFGGGGCVGQELVDVIPVDGPVRVVLVLRIDGCGEGA